MSKHVGIVGQKFTAEVTVTNVYEYVDHSFGYYGTTKYIYTMKDAEDNVIVWKTTKCVSVALDEECINWHFITKGDVIKVTGTVKEHGEYKETAQTVLTRCKCEFIEFALTAEERREQKRKEQLDSLVGNDFIWEKMPYKQYKEHYSDCETLANSFEYEDGVAVIDVIIREGRLKNSGVRGMHFAGFQFRTDEGKLVCYRAVNAENARKQMLKEYPNSEDWELVQIFRHSRRAYEY